MIAHHLTYNLAFLLAVGGKLVIRISVKNTNNKYVFTKIMLMTFKLRQTPLLKYMSSVRHATCNVK